MVLLPDRGTMPNHEHLSSAMQTGLGIYYFLVFLLNLGFAVWWYSGRKNSTQGSLWAVVSCVFLFHSFLFLIQAGPTLPVSIRNLVNAVMGPTTYFIAACIGFWAMLQFRRFFSDPVVA